MILENYSLQKWVPGLILPQKVVLEFFTAFLVGELCYFESWRIKIIPASVKNNKRGGPNKERGGWNFSPKLISGAGRLLGTLE